MLLLIIIISNMTIQAQNPYANYNHWITDNWVYAVASDGVNTYVGGSFSAVGPPTGAGTKITATNTNPDLSQCRPNSQVTVSIPDGLGGWYIGGNFTTIVVDSATTVTRNYLAHILPNGKLDLVWNPNPNNNVWAIAIDGANVYVGGWFTSIGGQVRNRLAKLSTIGTGLADATWNPNVTGGPDVAVWKLIVSGSNLFVSGNFTNIGGQLRNHIAKISTLGTGLADAVWDPNADGGGIETMLLNGNDLYVGGSFFNVGGQVRNRIAKLSAIGTGQADAVWDPNANGNQVSSLAINGNTLYVGGYFTSIGGLPRNNIARISTLGAGNAIIAWNPNTDYPVRTMSLSGSDLYIGGSFGTIGGQSYPAIAKLSSTGSGAPDPNWKPIINRYAHINTISTNGSDVYIGGSMTMLGGVKRNGLAKFSATGNCELDTAWHPIAGINSTIFALTLQGNYLYAGGDFNYPPASKLAKISTSGVGLLDPTWGGSANNIVRTLTVYGNYLYVGGDFTYAGGNSRNRISRLSTTTGISDPAWNPNINNTVRSIAVSAQGVFVGGDFTTVGVTNRNRIAKLNLANGALDMTWDANANSTVRALALNGTDLYVGGFFSNIGTQTRYRIAKLSTIGAGIADPIWNPQPNTQSSNVNSIILHSGYLYAAGNFDTLGGLPRNNIAKLNLTGTGSAIGNWNPNVFNEIYTMAACGNELYLGGGFHRVGGQSRDNIAKISTNANAPLPVSLNTFAGKKINTGNLLYWTTAMEQNNDFFTLQHSTDGIEFNQIAQIQSYAIQGNSTDFIDYQFEDLHAKSGHNYYRLLQTDLDGNQQIVSKTIDLIWQAEGPLFNLYPNPTAQDLNIDIMATQSNQMQLWVIDLNGKKMKQISISVTPGSNHISFPISDLAKGIYLFQVKDVQHQQLLYTEKLVIE
jgi:hypothetical protein